MEDVVAPTEWGPKYPRQTLQQGIVQPNMSSAKAEKPCHKAYDNFKRGQSDVLRLYENWIT